MTSVQRRVGAGVALLVALFLALVVVQMVVVENLQDTRLRHAERLGQARQANRDVLQHMTDAETGLRGFQLTGEKAFLSPYDSGRVGAYLGFSRAEELTGDAEVRRLLAAERQVASHWLYAYAIPIVNAGVADRDDARAARGREWFDRIRDANEAVDEAIAAEQRAVSSADQSRARVVQIVFDGLAVAFVVAALLMVASHHRQQLAPLEHIRRTLRRLAAGDRSARAVPSGTRELRAVIGTLNELAAETERLLAAERARTRRTELRQAVAAELRDGRDLTRSASRVAELLARAFGADAVHGRVAIDSEDPVVVCWPPGARPPDAEVIGPILAGPPGTAQAPAPGMVAVPFGGDTETSPGLVCLIRERPAVWSAEELRLLEAVIREIEYAVRQQRLHLRQARLIRELRALDEHKDAFVSTVTHELRTPLTSILGYAEMLIDDEDVTGTRRRAVEAIQRNAVRLRNTVADLLLLDPGSRGARADESVDLAAVASAVAAQLLTAAQAKGVVLTVRTAPAWVNGDPEHLSRALRYLLDNAVKFTPPGGAITCRVTGGDEYAGVEISDTGIGVPPDDQPGLFTPFHRGANAMDQAVQGSGLGLAIVRNIVVDHGGAISVRSALGSGTTFTVTLPATVPAVQELNDPAGLR